LPEEELLRQWQTAFQSGDYCGQFWAAASRRDLSIDARRQIFGTIHMAMHASAEQAAHAAFRLNGLQNKANEQEEKFKALALDRRSLRKENEALRHTLAEQQQRLRVAEGQAGGRPTPAYEAHDTPILEQENRRLAFMVGEQAGKLRIKER
jgi:hypothetical protein